MSFDIPSNIKLVGEAGAFYTLLTIEVGTVNDP